MTLIGRFTVTDDDGTFLTGDKVDAAFVANTFGAIEQTMNQSSTVPSGGVTHTITVAGLTACVAFLYDVTTGSLAIVLFQVGVAITIVSQIGTTVFVVGSPSTSQIQVTEAGGRLVILGGATRAGDTVRTTYFPM